MELRSIDHRNFVCSSAFVLLMHVRFVLRMRFVEQEGRFWNLFVVRRPFDLEVLGLETIDAHLNGSVAEAVIHSLAVKQYFRACVILEEGERFQFWFSRIAFDLRIHRDVSVAHQGADGNP